MQARLAVKVVEVGADDLAVLHPQAVAGDQERHAAGGIDAVVGAVGRAGLGLDDLDAIFEGLFDDDDAGEAGVGARCR